MSPLAASWTGTPVAGLDPQRVLAEPAQQSWSERGFAVALSGGRTSIAVSERLAVAVDGRLDAVGGHTHYPLTSAAQAISSAWLDRGEHILDEVLGDVLIVVYDRIAGTVSVARDRVGGRPGFVLTSHGSHVVVTHLPGLARCTALELRPDHDWTEAYLAGQWPAAQTSPYDGIAAVLPGHVAVPDGTRWSQIERAKWHLPAPPRRTTAEVAEQFRTVFDEAVAARIEDAGGDVAVTTSGGLDSTSALVTARAVQPDAQLHALAIPFTDPRGDERHLQEAVARAARAELHWVDVSADGPFGTGPDDVFGRYGAPPLTPNWFFHRRLEAAAVDAGVRQVLDGEDGDGVLGGNPSFLADLLGRGHVVTWAREAAALRRVHGDTVPELLRLSRFRVRNLGRAGGPGHLFDIRRRAYLRGGYLTRLMEGTYDDWTRVEGGMAHPFLDRRVIEFALPLPWHDIVKDGRQKVVLREAMRGRLPEQVRARSGKAQLSAPFEAMVSGPQRGWLAEGLSLARGHDSGTFRTVNWTYVAESAQAGDNFPGFRVAMVALWQEWLKHRQ